MAQSIYQVGDCLKVGWFPNLFGDLSDPETLVPNRSDLAHYLSGSMLENGVRQHRKSQCIGFDDFIAACSFGMFDVFRIKYFSNHVKRVHAFEFKEGSFFRM